MTIFGNRVRVSTATTGTGTLALGAATAGYAAFQEAGVSTGAYVPYTIEDGNSFEVGRGVYNSGAQTLTRAQVLLSKIAGQAADTTPLSLSGSAIVFLTVPAEDLEDLGALLSVRRFGAVGDGATDDTAAVTAAEGAAGAIFAPAGTYDTTIVQSALRGPFWGFGQVRDSVNNLRGPWFSAITAAPTVGDQTSVLTAFNGDLSGVQIAMEHRVTGAATAGQPTTGYMVKSEISPIFMYHFTDAGHNQSTSSNVGRTGQSMLNLNFAHAGQGDMGGLYINGIVVGSKPGATSFLASPAAAIIYGQLFSGATGAYMNVIELNCNDNGFQSAAIGGVFNFNRTVATATLGEVWMGLRPQSSGSVPADVVYSVGGTWKRGLDLTPGGFDSEAAITLDANQRIYGNAVASGTVAWSQALGDDWIEFNSGINAWSIVNGNVSQFQIYSNQVVTVPLAIFQSNVVVNHTAAISYGGGITPRLQQHGTDGSSSGFGQARYSNGATGAAHIFAKSRNASIAGQTVVQDGDTLGIIHFNGSDGTNFVNGAFIEARVSGTPGTTDMPTALIFHVSPDGSATPAEALRIRPDGELQFPAASFAANSATAATISVLPAGAATGASNKWLRIRDAAGVDSYIPVWQ